jgi:hypothetical protein
MWWEEFEKQLTSAFTIYNKKEGRAVHSPKMKLRILLNKVQADCLVYVKASIGMELTRQPITLTYEQALATFRNEVNRKFSPQISITRPRQELTNSSSASFQAYMAKKLDEMGFKSSVADPDVWLRPATKPDGEEYYKYMLMYVDAILAVSASPMPIIEEIQ